MSEPATAQPQPTHLAMDRRAVAAFIAQLAQVDEMLADIRAGLRAMMNDPRLAMTVAPPPAAPPADEPPAPPAEPLK